MIKILKCLHCGGEWVSRMNHLPKCCGKCHCYNWNKSPVKRLKTVKIKSPEQKHPLNDLPVGESYLYKWVLDSTGYPDAKGNMAIHHSIGRHAKRHNREYIKEPVSQGIRVYRVR